MLSYPMSNVKSQTDNVTRRYALLAAYDDRVDRLGLDCLTQAESEEYVCLQRWWWARLTMQGSDPVLPPVEQDYTAGGE
jgi:hypothetical protein